MPYLYPANYGQIQTQKRVDIAETVGGEFDFSNDGTFNLPTTIAANGWFAVDIRQQRKYLDALNYAPFNALSISNDSNVNVKVYLNTTYPDSKAKKIFVASKTDRTYDLAKVTACVVENLSSTTAISANEINLLFIKSSLTVDSVAEKLSGLLGHAKPLYARKEF